MDYYGISGFGQAARIGARLSKTERGRAVLEQVLEAGRIAPTACNRQPVHLLVAHTPESVAKVCSAANLYGATAAIVVCRCARSSLGTLVRRLQCCRNRCSHRHRPYDAAGGSPGPGFCLALLFRPG